MPLRYKRILIINTFGIGDVLFSMPMLRALKKNIPDSRIDFMCNERCRHILQNNKNIDDILVFEKDEFRKNFHDSKINFIRQIYEFFIKIKRKKYDLAIDLSLGYQISMFLALFGIKKRVGFNYRNRGKFLTDKLDINGFNIKHAVEYYLDLVELLGIERIGNKQLELDADPEAEKWSDAFIDANALKGKKLVGIAPGGGMSWGEFAAYRRWAPESFSSVAHKLYGKDKNTFFLIFGSTEEKKLCSVIKANLPENSLDLCGKLALTQSVALIKRCRLLICNDGGLLHIAVSQNVNTVSIFGPVDDKVYGPYSASAKHKVVRAEGLKCRPCYNNFRHQMCDTRECLRKIDSDKVFEFAAEALTS